MQELGHIIRRSPGVIVISLAVFGLLCGLGIFGVKEAAGAEAHTRYVCVCVCGGGVG